MDPLELLIQINFVIVAALLIAAFSLLIYLLTYYFRSRSARGAAWLLASVFTVYLGDLILFFIEDPHSAERWLRLQWLGIAITPAAYAHLTDALLERTGSFSPWRRWAVRGAYGLGAAWFLLAIGTDLLVHDGTADGRAFHLWAGPLFPLFLVYFISGVAWGVINAWQARRRTLISTHRRRLTYLAATMIAPAVGVFPYLLLVGRTLPSFPAVFWGMVGLGNLIIGTMLFGMVYAVAYLDVLVPDRVIKQRWIDYLLRGPVLATFVVLVMFGLSRLSHVLGLPLALLLPLVAAATIVSYEIFSDWIRPLFEWLFLRRDVSELARMRRLSDAMITARDLRQFLEGILALMCEALRSPTGFVVRITPNGIEPVAAFGAIEQASIEETLSVVEGSADGPIAADGFWIWPLRSRGDPVLLGAIAVAQPAGDAGEVVLEPLQDLLRGWVARAAAALEDRMLQERALSALEQVAEEVSRLRQPEQAPSAAPLVEHPEFTHWVKEALAHYWGGPRLLQSPLLQLRIVQQAMEAHDGNPIRALRAVLAEAIEQLRPDGERKLTAPEWLLYNLLEMRFIQGRKVREIAQRLALSESDLYRKQRAAIEAVAVVLAEMERRAARVLAEEGQPPKPMGSE
ncbi:histidine kinase N-terminal 7TM domain-containing protein [Thermoflexus sp.]|uniref:histidine kinase N-terminal 7TM domain-containing protein n=1 Tax=Thermoflexus sp. TaxID=1969742 RepID=UPI0025F4753E|nr:histidine kinase N-terminal 7TM domain-containing protein [Thermoflexus sp.]MCS7350180.1 hypothetical protein [Thermoflexus sp.]MCX7689545.1 hypothetical protein [Thermoflexus sp.]MDW8179629.1 histidine kinase N-terminal 7TM domain-containing protein [Anaerolineae bacterium]MDW8185287.1 histidine kinase N-terminal 7TM domain-containing protein [Anaerolineae bacterium]